ncbi:hypothetical protein ACA910_010799 [Epithemia clementina (nom. ined.)]
MFHRVPWRSTASKNAEDSPPEKTIKVHRPRRSAESMRQSPQRASEENNVIQRPLRHSGKLLSSCSMEDNVAALDSAEEAVADPGLTVELDLSENVVGLRGRAEELLSLETVLRRHIFATSSFHQTTPVVVSNDEPGDAQQKSFDPLSVVLVSGSSGTGKTSLIHHWVSLRKHRILFGEGKFDQNKKSSYNGPYGVLLQALQGVIQRLLKADNNEKTISFQQTLRTSLCDHLTPSQRSCMQDLLPDLKLFLDMAGVENVVNAAAEDVQSADDKGHPSRGAARRVIREHGEESGQSKFDADQEQHLAYQVTRVTLALRSFLCALAETNRPLVLFFDDLQWADDQSLAAISKLFMEFSWTAQIGTEQNHPVDSVNAEGDSPINVESADKPVLNGKILIFVGAYRCDDTAETTATSMEMSERLLVKQGTADAVHRKLEQLGKMSTEPSVRIHLNQLDFEHTHQIINSALRLDSERTKTLADVVYRKTNGNPYFVLRFLEMLHRERLLFYSFTTYQWQWNLDLIQTETNVTDNVVDLLSRHIDQLPEEVQAVLRLASCLGFYFDIVVLREICLREGILSDAARNSRFNSRATKMKLASEERETLSLRSRNALNTSKYGKLMASRYDPIIRESEQRENEALCATWLVYVLGRAEREGLIERASNKQYKFSHDRVQRCLYEATPSGKPRDMLHLRIGRLVRDTYLTNLDEEDTSTQNAMLYFAVEQLNMSSAYIKDVDERIGLIELNLEASDKAGEHLTFLAAARFLRKAQSLFRDDDWDERYELCLEVYSAVAAVEHSCGNSVAALGAVDVVMRKAHCFDDKLRALFIKVNDLGVQGRLGEAIKEGCAALEHLGEALPSKLGSFNTLKDIYNTNKALKSLSKSQLLNLPEMTNPSKIAAMRLLNSLSLFAWHAAEESLLTLIFLRMMSITLKYGQNHFTPFAFATFSMLLAAHGDSNTASEFGQLSLEMLQRSKSLVALPRTHLIIYTFINHIRQPLLHGVEPLLNAHRIGLESGELEYGSLAVSSYASLYVIFGLPLPNFSTDMRTISEQLHHFRQNVALAALLPWWQFGMNLMGESANVLKLTGEAMIEEVFESDVAGKAAEKTLNFIRLMLSYLFDELDVAMGMYDKLREWQKATLTGTHYINHFQHCYCGLLNMSMARKTGKSKFRKNAKGHLSELEKLVKSGAMNCSPMLLILKAEDFALSGNHLKAQETYNMAISRSARSGFIHLQAITNERAGFYNHGKGDFFWASTYLSQALRNYSEWGANAKVENLLKKCRDLGISIDFSTESLRHAVSLKGRTRFKATPLRLRASFQG